MRKIMGVFMLFVAFMLAIDLICFVFMGYYPSNFHIGWSMFLSILLFITWSVLHFKEVIQ